ncbi:DUF1828 domain-containing protein [Oceanobacillus kimchii]|uniref:DUF1828 domain-containing protein n=1 Tax=Oceanobacillus kimchii TaxID=746691 RepID=UPI003C717FE4
MIKDLRSLFDEWNKKNISFEQYDNFIEITTPFVDMHHDFIQLYFTKESNNKYKLTDDGYIINELNMLGIDINTSKKRKEFFNTTLKIFGVTFDNRESELIVSFDNLSDYPIKQHNLIQCLIRISDMLLTAKNTVASIFTEEISNFFEENDVFYSPNIGINGTSGNQQNFDFLIPHRKNKKEKLIKAVNTPSADNYVSPLFSFIDIKDNRQKSDYLLIANDQNIEIADKFSSSLKNWNIEILAWSNRDKWVKELKII